MAGMLPGVESARRRRFHQSGGWSDSPAMASHNSTRRSSLCLYASNHESLFSSSSLLVGTHLSISLSLFPFSSLFLCFQLCCFKWKCIDFLLAFEHKQQKSKLYQAHPDDNLGGAAMEAKERLDERLRAQRKSENKRYNNFYFTGIQPATQI